MANKPLAAAHPEWNIANVLPPRVDGHLEAQIAVDVTSFAAIDRPH